MFVSVSAVLLVYTCPSIIIDFRAYVGTIHEVREEGSFLIYFILEADRSRSFSALSSFEENCARMLRQVANILRNLTIFRWNVKISRFS